MDQLMNTSKTYLVTGAVGFIGFYVSKRLLANGCHVIGIDNVNGYYERELKYARLGELQGYDSFVFVRGDIADHATVVDLFAECKPHVVIHLAAQAGVRYSIQNPDAYIQSNVLGFFHVLEACRNNPVEHLLYASSSSVYGSNKKVPFEETDVVDGPISLYAATKKSNELMAHAYGHLYQIPSTGLRFFTAYGPMGRPDMAYFGFANQYVRGEAIHIYHGDGEVYRDFTYIDDIVEAVVRLIGKPPTKQAYSRILNVGNHSPVRLLDFIATLERCLGIALHKDVVFDKVFEPMQPGDVLATYASTKMLQEIVGFQPETSLEDGLQRFADWYVGYYQVK